MAREIWVIEDDATISTWAADILNGRGYRVRVFDRAFPALEALSDLGAAPLPLLLVDDLLPDQLGSEFCQRLRQDPALKSLVMILMSGRDKNGTLAMEAKHKYGCNGFLAKPFQVESLLGIVESHLPVDDIAEPSGPEQPARDLSSARPVARPTVNLQGRLGAEGVDVARLLCELVARAFTGRLDVHHEQITRSLWFERGQLVNASSNAAMEQLPALLTRKKILTPQQLKDVEVLSHGHESAFFGALVQLQLVPAQKLFELSMEQAHSVVLSTFLWFDGDYTCQQMPELPKDLLRLNLSLPALLLEGLQAAYDEDGLRERFGEHLVQAGPGMAEKLQLLRLGPRESKMLHSLSTPHTIEEIVDSTELAALEALQVLYAMDCLNGIQQLS